MSSYTTVNGFRVKTHEHKNHRVPTHARRLCADLDRDHPAVERIDYALSSVSVWLDDGRESESFRVPEGWRVDMVGVYGGGVCLDLEPEAGQ